MSSIRKERKARWIYSCTLCDIERASVDHFGAIEHEQAHERGSMHFWHLMREAMQGFTSAFEVAVNAFATTAKAVAEAADQAQSAFALAPPQNLPHDPALLRDKRKWGGR